jgi:hypothetical protein
MICRDPDQATRGEEARDMLVAQLETATAIAIAQR